MAPVHAVLFDYGLVLSGPPDPAAWTSMKAISGLDEVTLQRAYWAHRHPYDRGDLDALAYWACIAQDASLFFTPDQVRHLIQADVDLWGQLNPPMVDWAAQLQRAGIRTGILSNIGDAMAHGLVARHDWISAFHHCVWSYSLNLAKPEAAIYRHAAKSLDTPAANILFIDDKQENIDAALASGMQAIQYTSHPPFEHELQARGLGFLLTPEASRFPKREELVPS